MDKVYESGASTAPPVPPAIPSVGYPSRGNPATGAMPTVPGPYMMHQLVEELMAVIAAGNIVPDKLVLNQLKLALDAVYVKRNGTSPILQNFPGLTRSLTALGGGLVREYVDIPNAATVGGIEICTVYNCAIDPVSGVWAGRDIADICWLEKWHDVAGTKEIWFAPAAAAAAVPVWVLASSLSASTGALTIGGTVSAAVATLPTHLLRQDQATVQFTPASYSSKGDTIAVNTALTSAQAMGQTYLIVASATITLPVAPAANSEVTIITNASPVTVAAPAGILMVYPDGVRTVAGTLLLGNNDTAILTWLSGAWFITFMTGQPIVKPAVLPNQAVNLGQFLNLKAAAGYQKLPGGMILQWGAIPTVAPGTFSAAVVFPIAFPTLCVGVFPVWVGGGAGAIEITTPSQTAFIAGNPTPFTTANPGLYFAIGY